MELEDYLSDSYWKLVVFRSNILYFFCDVVYGAKAGVLGYLRYFETILEIILLPSSTMVLIVVGYAKFILT